jgi:UTP--glucose-1-phosphate uridylyltransferase
MRPATRVVPKAFLPLIDRPAIQYAVEEAAASGATDVVAVVDPDVVDLVLGHFAEPLAGLDGVTVTPVVQPEPRGLGDAVLTAANAVGRRPFMCMLVDELLKPGHNVFDPLVDAAGAGSAVAVRTVDDPERLSRYGVVAVGDESGGSYPMTGAVEKPPAGTAPSNLALVGRYVFQPTIFEALRSIEPGHGGEIQLTDAINVIAADCRAVIADDALLDIGNPLGMAKAKHALASRHPDWGDEYRQYVADDS